MMQGSEASGPPLAVPSTFRTVIGNPPTSLSTVPVHAPVQTGLSLSQQQFQESIQDVISSVPPGFDGIGAVAAGGNSTGSTGKGILIGILSAFGSAVIAVAILALFFFFKYTRRGRIMLDRIGRPGEYDDEQAFVREEEAALQGMDDLSRSEYLRAKGNADSGFLPVQC